jgi:non-specific protein-tyrosine kinase
MEIRTYVQPLLRWWWLLLAAALVGAGASYLAVRNQPAVYRSHATLMTGRTIDDPNPTGSQFSTSQQLAETYADIASREPVRRAVMRELGLEALPAYQVNVIPGTQLIEISVLDTSAVRAQAVASAFADQLIQISPSGVQPEEQERQDFIRGQLDKLQTQIEETEAEIETKQEELGGLFSAQDINETQSEISALQAKLSSLQSNYASLLATTPQDAVNSLSVIEPASLPGQPVDPNLEVTVAAAAAVGLLLAAVAAYGLSYVDDTIKVPDDVERVTKSQVPALASIARMKGLDRGDRSKLIALDQPRTPHAEAFRMLRTGIQYAGIDRGDKHLLVTSPRPGDGKSLTAANLAVVLAQSGSRVVLLDADLRQPTQHKLFDAGNDQGLGSLLLEMALRLELADCEDAGDEIIGPLIEKVLQPTKVAGLKLMTSGPIPANPSELLGSAWMKATLRVLAHRYDYVILDSPPCLAVTDPIVLATQVDAVLLVASAGSTRRKELKHALGRLRSVNAHVLGVTLNRLSSKSENYYYMESYYSDVEDAEAKASAASVVTGMNGNKSGVAKREA